MTSAESQLEPSRDPSQQPSMVTVDAKPVPKLQEEIRHQVNSSDPPELETQASKGKSKETTSFCLTIIGDEESKSRRRSSSKGSKQSSTSTLSSNDQNPTDNMSPSQCKLIIVKVCCLMPYIQCNALHF